MGKVDVTTQIVISVPIEKLIEYSSDPDNATEWYTNIKSVEWLTSKKIAVGSKIKFKANFLGRKLEYVYEISELIPNEKIAMKTADGPFPMETIYSWEMIDSGRTRMILQNRGIPSGFSAFFSPMMSTMMKKANKKDLMRLKRILEKTD